MTDLRTAAQMALDALDSKHDMTKAEWRVLQYHAFTALRAALTQGEQEPVAWELNEVILDSIRDSSEVVAPPQREPEPDYETKFIKDWNEGKVRRISDGKRMVPQREWQGLTDEECEEVERWVEFKEEGSGRIPMGKLIRYIEAKLKEKNNVA